MTPLMKAEEIQKALDSAVANGQTTIIEDPQQYVSLAADFIENGNKTSDKVDEYMKTKIESNFVSSRVSVFTYAQPNIRKKVVMISDEIDASRVMFSARAAVIPDGFIPVALIECNGDGTFGKIYWTKGFKEKALNPQRKGRGNGWKKIKRYDIEDPHTVGDTLNSTYSAFFSVGTGKEEDNGKTAIIAIRKDDKSQEPIKIPSWRRFLVTDTEMETPMGIMTTYKIEIPANEELLFELSKQIKKAENNVKQQLEVVDNVSMSYINELADLQAEYERNKKEIENRQAEDIQVKAAKTDLDLYEGVLKANREEFDNLLNPSSSNESENAVKIKVKEERKAGKKVKIKK